MNILTRATRHARISWRARAVENPSSPPFLILFITSICNLTCEHCFYWRNLNQRDDLTVDEIFKLAREMGPIENLNLGGGEPFIRKEYAEICRFFIRNNHVKQIYCPTSGYFTDRTVRAGLVPSELDTTIGLTIAGALTPAGLGGCIIELMERGLTVEAEGGSVLTITDRPGQAPLFTDDETYVLRGVAAAGQISGEEVVRSFRDARRLSS